MEKKEVEQSIEINFVTDAGTENFNSFKIRSATEKMMCAYDTQNIYYYSQLKYLQSNQYWCIYELLCIIS